MEVQPFWELFWAAVSGAGLLWLGQKFTGDRESKQRMREQRQRLYFELSDHIGAVHICITEGCCDDKKARLAEEMTAIHLKIQTTGSNRVIDAWANYMKYATDGGRCRQELTYLFRCIGYAMGRDFRNFLYCLRKPKRSVRAEVTLAIPRRVGETERNLAVGSPRSVSSGLGEQLREWRQDRCSGSKSIPGPHPVDRQTAFRER